MPVASSRIWQQHFQAPIQEYIWQCIFPSPQYHEFCKHWAKPFMHSHVVYRVLPWSYSLPPVDGQNDQEGLPCRCNVPILQKSYSLWSLKHNIKHLHPPNLHGCMRTDDEQKWYHPAGTRSHICWKCIRTCPYMAHPPSIAFQVTKSQDGTLSKNPQGSHILGACPPSYSSQRHQTNNHFEWSAHELSYSLQRATTLAHAFRVNPLRGGRQQPHQSLSKFEKYNGGRKHHLMVVLSLPKIFKCNHSDLKANSILSWMSRSLSGLGALMAFQVAMPTSIVATQACWSTLLREYLSSKCLQHLLDQR